LVSCTPTPTPTTPTPTVTVASPIITPTPPESPVATPTLPPVLAPTTTPLAIPTVITDALINGGMNSPYEETRDYSTVKLPWGWSFGWSPHPPCTHDQPGCTYTCPLNCVLTNGKCSNDEGCSWMMPEAGRVLCIEHGCLRTLEGDASAKVICVGRQCEFWYFQTAMIGKGNIGTFSAYLQALQCLDWANCSKGQRSDKPTAMNLKVGIDPYGGTSPFSANVVWSPTGDAQRIDKNSPNIWYQFVVTTTALAPRVTVFIYSRPDWSLPSTLWPALWDGNYARWNQDLYADKTQLRVLMYYPLQYVRLPLVKENSR
jgi:hypothetical protein